MIRETIDRLNLTMKTKKMRVTRIKASKHTLKKIVKKISKNLSRKVNYQNLSGVSFS